MPRSGEHGSGHGDDGFLGTLTGTDAVELRLLAGTKLAWIRPWASRSASRTHEGWLYLAVVVDLFSRQVVGWSMGSRIDTSLVLDALLMALWRRKPEDPVTVRSDQGCQFTAHEWQTFLREHNLISSIGRRGNCHYNAGAESFFQLLKRERVRRRSMPRAVTTRRHLQLHRDVL